MKESVSWWRQPLPWHLRILVLLNAASLMLLFYVFAGIIPALAVALPGFLAANLASKLIVRICRTKQVEAFYQAKLASVEAELATQKANNGRLSSQKSRQGAQLRVAEADLKRLLRENAELQAIIDSSGQSQLPNQ